MCTVMPTHWLMAQSKSDRYSRNLAKEGHQNKDLKPAIKVSFEYSARSRAKTILIVLAHGSLRWAASLF